MQILAGEMALRENRQRRPGRGGSHVEVVSNPELSVSGAQLTSFILDALSLPSRMTTSSWPEDPGDKMPRTPETIPGVTSSRTPSQSSGGSRLSCSWASDDDVNSNDAFEETSNEDYIKA